MEEVDTIKKLILQKLIRGNVWGGKHTPFDYIIKGIPEHYRNTHSGIKIIDDAVKYLVNQEWVIIIQKRTGKGSGDHLSLNPRKVAEIKQYLSVTI